MSPFMTGGEGGVTCWLLHHLEILVFTQLALISANEVCVPSIPPPTPHPQKKNHTKITEGTTWLGQTENCHSVQFLDWLGHQWYCNTPQKHIFYIKCTLLLLSPYWLAFLILSPLPPPNHHIKHKVSQFYSQQAPTIPSLSKIISEQCLQQKNLPMEASLCKLQYLAIKLQTNT